jgi:hypothetical protein
MSELNLEPGWLERQIADTRAEVATWPPGWTTPNFKLGDRVEDSLGIHWDLDIELRHAKETQRDKFIATCNNMNAVVFPSGNMRLLGDDRPRRVVRIINRPESK